MRKLFKSRKALSPVVAAIILIAVTVAVSIAVAAWMGALTFTFMKTEELKITSMTFGPNAGGVYSGGVNNTIVLQIRNSGTSKVTVSETIVNDVAKTPGTGSKLVYEAGETGTITIYMGGTTAPTYWTSGNKYKVSLLSSTGTTVAAYETTA
jgi:flagellin-like protein